MIQGLFDDHSEALSLWKEAGLRGLTCLHVDAHLDVMAEGFTSETLKGIAAAGSGAELARFRGDPRLPWGGLHCGNYLYPALLDGTVTTLIWLLPGHILKVPSLLEAVRMELASWIDLTFAEDRSLREVEGRIEGELLGRRFVVCTSESMPALSQPQQASLALDIDIDYFVRLSDDRIWQTPHQLHDALGSLRPQALTVALSCDGGYTPVSERFLGKLCLEVFSGQPERRRHEMEMMRAGQWEALLARGPEDWKPSALLHLGRDEEASRLDPDYLPQPLNQAARCLQKGETESGLAILSRSGEPDKARHFLTAFLAAGRDSTELSGSQLETLLGQPDLGDFERARLWREQAEVCVRRAQPRRAVEALKKALKLEPDRAETRFRLAVLQRRMGERDAAARSLRKALELAAGRVSSLPMLLEAWRLYRESGQPALARAARTELETHDASGVYLAQALLEEGQARRCSNVPRKGPGTIGPESHPR